MSPEPAGTLVVVDDHARFRQAVRELLTAAGWRILGEAAAGADALEVAGRLAPDVVLLDVVLPDMDGFAVAEHLAAAGCVSAVVLTSGHDRRDFAGRALAALLAGGRP
ncbi:MAG: response regulator [Streptosporangiaceae bacterium]